MVGFLLLSALVLGWLISILINARRARAIERRWQHALWEQDQQE